MKRMKRMKRIMVIILIFSIIMPDMMGFVPENTIHGATSSVVTVTNQTELNRELGKKSKKKRTIYIKTKKAKKFIIKKANYKYITLKINAPKSTITNKSTLKSITVSDASKVYEDCIGNLYYLNDKKLTLHISNTSKKTQLILNRKNADLNINCKGTVKTLTLKQKGNVKITGSGKIQIIAKQDSMGSIITNKTTRRILLKELNKTIYIEISKKIVVGEDIDKKHDNKKDDDKSTTSSSGYTVVKHFEDGTFENASLSKGTKLSSITAPFKENKVFLGWYYDAEYKNGVSNTDTLTKNIDLYAKYADSVSLEGTDTEDYIAKQNVEPNFSIQVKALGKNAAWVEEHVKLSNNTDSYLTEDGDYAVHEQLTVSESGDGIFTLSPMHIQEGIKSDGSDNLITYVYQKGNSYQVELLDNDLSFVEAGENSDVVRFYNFSVVEDKEYNHLTLKETLKYIDANEDTTKLSDADRTLALSLTGLCEMALEDDKNEVEENRKKGVFTYKNSDAVYHIGDTIVFYEGNRPDLYEVKDSDRIAYVTILGVDSTVEGITKYSYEVADVKDVIFLPDVLPIDVDKKDGVLGYKEDGTSISISNEKLDFSDSIYKELGLSANTTLDVGDFLLFYTGDLKTGENGKQLGYGKVVGVQRYANTTSITYESVSESEMYKSSSFYNKRELTEEEMEKAYDEEVIRSEVESQLIESGFIEETGKEYAAKAMEVDDVQKMLGTGVNATDLEITYADGTAIDEFKLQKGNAFSKKYKNGVKVDVVITPKLEHFSTGLTGFRAEVTASYSYKIKKKDAGDDASYIKLNFTGFFEAEVKLGISVKAGIVWKKKKIWFIKIPYPSDFKLTGSIEKGIYTGLGMTATAELKSGESNAEQLAYNKREAKLADKIVNITEKVKKLSEKKEKLLPESKGSAGGSLQEKYYDFANEASDAWVDLLALRIFDFDIPLGPFHILVLRVKADWVITANLKFTAGVTFYMEKSERHSVTITLFKKNADSGTQSTSKQELQFDAYIMGVAGIRTGIRLGVTFGLFSGKLDGIGLEFEGGCYVRVWGYCHYHFLKAKGRPGESVAAGALLFDLGGYFDIRFLAEALNGRFQCKKRISSNEYPIWGIGSRQNVYDFNRETDGEDEEENITHNMIDTKKIKLSSDVFAMKYMDLKTGESGELDDVDPDDFVKIYDSNKRCSNNSNSSEYDDEENFYVEMTNPVFVYNPIDNTITVDDNGNGELSYTGDMKLVWKGNTLAFNTSRIERIIHLTYKAVKDAKHIYFDTNGGSTMDSIAKTAGGKISKDMQGMIPTKVGYDFAGWYNNKECSGSSQQIPEIMPNSDITYYAKWKPRNKKVVIEEYMESQYGRYELISTIKSDKEYQIDSKMISDEIYSYANSPAGFHLNQDMSTNEIMVEPLEPTVIKLYYTRNTHTITLTYGSLTDNDKYKNLTYSFGYGKRVQIPNLTAEGYIFNGWNEGEIPNRMPDKDLKFTASWKTKEYNIQLQLTGGYFEDGAENPTVYTIKSPDIYLMQPKKDGYTFIGWLGTGLSGLCQTVEIPSGSTGNKAFSANWKIEEGYSQIIYDYDGGEMQNDTNPEAYKQGDHIIIHEPVREGCEFAGWTGSGLNEMTKTVEMVATGTETLTFKAHWLKKCNITYDLRGGILEDGKTNPMEYSNISEEITLHNPVREGYVFEGWTGTGMDGISKEVVINPQSVFTDGDREYTAVWSDNEYMYVGDYKLKINLKYNSTIYEENELTTNDVKLCDNQLYVKVNGQYGCRSLLTVGLVDGVEYTNKRLYIDTAYGVNTYEVYFQNLVIHATDGPAVTNSANCYVYHYFTGKNEFIGTNGFVGGGQSRSYLYLMPFGDPDGASIIIRGNGTGEEEGYGIYSTGYSMFPKCFSSEGNYTYGQCTISGEKGSINPGGGTSKYFYWEAYSGGYYGGMNRRPVVVAGDSEEDSKETLYQEMMDREKVKDMPKYIHVSWVVEED